QLPSPAERRVSCQKFGPRRGGGVRVNSISDRATLTVGARKELDAVTGKAPDRSEVADIPGRLLGQSPHFGRDRRDTRAAILSGDRKGRQISRHVLHAKTCPQKPNDKLDIADILVRRII